ncbi:MAG TPA: extracellular solute-binding protein [Microbacteriaceae bacterium]|nr:extracellular solute-binding protein [Microbacteriaceae bacterium]
MRGARKGALVGTVAVAALSALALTGCSSGGSSGGSGSSGSTSGGAKTSIAVEDYYTQPTTGIMDKVYQACAAEENVKVTSSHVPGAGFIPKVLQQASSKTLPDVLMLDNPNVKQIAQTGALSPLSDYGISAKGFAPAIAQAGSYDGKVYALAPAINTIDLIYNTTMFQEAGITTPPTTWAELQTDAQKLTKKGVYGFAFSADNDGEGTWQFLPFMWSNGGTETDITTAPTVQALQFLTGMIQKGTVSKSVVNWGQSDVLNQFLAGKAAMMINGPWEFPQLSAQKKIVWKQSPIPTRTASQTLQSPLGGETFTVPNTGDKTKMAAAGKLVKCILSPANQAKIAASEGDVPGQISVATSFAQSHPLYAAIATSVKTARARTAKLGAKWPATQTAINVAEQTAFSGKASPKAALQQANSQKEQ